VPDRGPPPASHRWVTGVHRVEGLVGPVRRFTIIVALLVGLASLPILAAIGAGSGTIGATGSEEDTAPFIVEPPRVPVVVVPPAVPDGAARSGASPATGPWGVAKPIAERPWSSPAARPAAGVRTPHRRTRVRHGVESTPYRPATRPTRPAARPDPPAVRPVRPARPGHSARPGGCGRHKPGWRRHGHWRHHSAAPRGTTWRRSNR